MSDTQHTKGPWQVTHNSQGETFVDYTGDTGSLFAVARVYATSGNQEADARLIAAAPDLLAALLEVQSRYASVSERGAIEVAITPDLYDQIEQALTRAIADPSQETDDDRRQQEHNRWWSGQ